MTTKSRLSGEILYKKTKCHECNWRWERTFNEDDEDYVMFCPRCRSIDWSYYHTEYGDIIVEFWFGENWRSVRHYTHNTRESIVERDYEEFLEQKVEDIIHDSNWRIKKGGRK